MPVIPRLKDREEAFCAVHVSFAAHVFLCAVVDGAVTGKAPADRLVSVALVSRHQLAFGVGAAQAVPLAPAKAIPVQFGAALNRSYCGRGSREAGS
jgi:hypothetical protein